MNLFSLGFKSDNNLKNYLNNGNININPSQNDSNTQNSIDLAQSSQMDNLLNNNEKISIGISQSNIEESPIEKGKEEKEEKEERVQGDLKNEEKNEEWRRDSMILDSERSLFLKIFGPMEAGSIRGSIFNMVILSLGTGMFALPKYMSNTSLVFSCLFIVGICICVWWSLLLIIQD